MFFVKINTAVKIYLNLKNRGIGSSNYYYRWITVWIVHASNNSYTHLCLYIIDDNVHTINAAIHA